MIATRWRAIRAAVARRQASRVRVLGGLFAGLRLGRGILVKRKATRARIFRSYGQTPELIHITDARGPFRLWYSRLVDYSRVLIQLYSQTLRQAALQMLDVNMEL